MKLRLFAASVMFAGVLLGAHQSAEARRIAIDFGSAFSSGNDFGATPDVAQELNLTDDASTPTPISLGFTINFGLGNFDSVYINENGIVSFGSALTGFTPVSSLTELVGSSGQPAAVIAPYYANLTSVPGNNNLFDNTSPTGEIYYQRGSVDLTLLPGDSQYTFDDPLQAFRVTWNGLNGVGDPVFAQLYLYSLGADGSFGMEFAYGADAPMAAQGGSIAGYVLGSSSAVITAPYDGNRFSFTNGETSVPEPATWALLAAAILAMPLILRRKRRSWESATSPLAQPLQVVSAA